MSREYVADFVQTALKGEAVTQVLEGQRRFDLVVRLREPHRSDATRLGELRLDLPNGKGQVRLKDGTPLKVPGIVPKLSATPGDIEWSGPELGEHTAAVLAAQGYSASDIAGLKERRVI